MNGIQEVVSSNLIVSTTKLCSSVYADQQSFYFSINSVTSHSSGAMTSDNFMNNKKMQCELHFLNVNDEGVY